MLRHVRLPLLLCIVGALIATPAAAQEPPPEPAAIDVEPEEDSNVITTGHTVTATVTDAEGNPVPGATVHWFERGAGEIVAQENVTDENGQAQAVTTSNDPGTQVIVGSLEPGMELCAEQAEATGRCDRVLKHWTDGPFGNPALECSGGGYALELNGSRFAEIPNEERPCPPAGSEEDPTVEQEEVIGVPANPILEAGVLRTTRTFSSTGATTESQAAEVIVLETLEISVAEAYASSQCDPRGVASQELSGGIVTIRDAETGEVIFQGAAPPNTELDLSPVARIVLNEQDPEGGTVGPSVPGEVQPRSAEGSVTAVRIELLAEAVVILIGHAESDVTCKQHAYQIDLEPEEASNPTGTSHRVTATVTDEAGRPVVGESVTWTEEGPGDFVRAEERTDRRGQARAVVRSFEEGDQTITASLDPETTKCGEEGGVCSDSVVKHWVAEGPQVTEVRVHGNGHTYFDETPTAVHLHLDVGDNYADEAPPFVVRPVLYADDRADPPGDAAGPFVCGNGIPDEISLVELNHAIVEGTIDCTGQTHEGNAGELPEAVAFRLEVVDNGGQNPPNQDAYQMTLFDAAGNVVYEYGDLTTPRRGNLRVDVSMQ